MTTKKTAGLAIREILQWGPARRPGMTPRPMVLGGLDQILQWGPARRPGMTPWLRRGRQWGRAPSMGPGPKAGNDGSAEFVTPAEMMTFNGARPEGRE